MGNICSRELVGIVFGKMRSCAKNGDFMILKREINTDFIERHSLSRQKQQCILLGITLEDYCESEPSEKVSGSYIHVFGPQVQLQNRFGASETVELYVKFEIIERPHGDMTVFISFHEQTYPATYPFREQRKEGFK